MNKLTAGECVTILGRQWAEDQGIRTATDMAKPATEEQQKLAQWATNAMITINKKAGGSGKGSTVSKFDSPISIEKVPKTFATVNKTRNKACGH